MKKLFKLNGETTEDGSPLVDGISLKISKAVRVFAKKYDLSPRDTILLERRVCSSIGYQVTMHILYKRHGI